MILKTLKQKPKISLILDDEFIQYCELNDIKDIEKFATELYQKGFTIVKYGELPDQVKAKVVNIKGYQPKVFVDDVEIEDPSVIDVSTKIQKSKTVIKTNKVDNKDIYDE